MGVSLNAIGKLTLKNGNYILSGPITLVKNYRHLLKKYGEKIINLRLKRNVLLIVCLLSGGIFFIKGNSII